MTVTAPTFGLWSEQDAVLWPERTHPPSYLTGAAFRVWEAVARLGTEPEDEGLGLAAGTTDRILVGLEARGLLASPPEPLVAAPLVDEVVVTLDDIDLPLTVHDEVAAAWSARPAPGAEPVLRVRTLPDGTLLVANAGNGLPVTVADEAEARRTVEAAGRRLTDGSPDGLAVPLEAWSSDDAVVLISPVLVARSDVREACAAIGVTPAGSPVTDLAGIGLTVDGRPVTALVLDQSWTAANPEGGPLALPWLLACLLSTCNPVRACGRYALLDAASRVVHERSVAWGAADAPERVPDLLARLPGAAGVTPDRAELGQALAGGWRAAEAELCRNLWFGDAGRLAEDARSAFAGSVAERLGEAAAPSPGRAWDDPLTRCLLLRDDDLDAVGVIRLLDDVAPVADGGAFARALAADDRGTAAAHLAALLGAGGGSSPRAERFDDVFERFVLPQLTDGPVGHQAATPAVAEQLLTVCSRTAHAAPLLFESAWSFVGDVAVIAEPDAAAMAVREAPLPDSFSQPGLSGIVFFSPWVLDLPWHAEVTVLHEAVHQKLYTLLLTRPLFDDVVDEDATAVPVPWRDTTWPVRRAVSACHAYVHMAVAFGALVDWAVEHDEPLLPDDGGGDDPLVLLQVHVERMLYLSEKVARFDRATLAEAGVDLIRWLRAVALDLAAASHRPNPGLGVYP